MPDEMTNPPVPPEQPPATPPEHYVGAPPPAPPKMSFIDKIVGILTEPRAFFTSLRARPEWLTPFLTIGIITAGLFALSIPKAVQISHLAIEEAGRRSGQTMPEVAYKFGEGSAYASPVSMVMFLIVGWVVVTAIVYFIAIIVGASLDFRRVWTVVLWAGFPSIFGLAVRTVYLMMTPPPTTMAEANSSQMFTLSVGQLMPQGSLLQTLTVPIDIFTIWGLFLLYEGLVHMLKVKRDQAGIVVIVYAIIGYLILAGLLFASTAAQRMQ